MGPALSNSPDEEGKQTLARWANRPSEQAVAQASVAGATAGPSKLTKEGLAAMSPCLRGTGEFAGPAVQRQQGEGVCRGCRAWWAECQIFGVFCFVEGSPLGPKNWRRRRQRRRAVVVGSSSVWDSSGGAGCVVDGGVRLTCAPGTRGWWRIITSMLAAAGGSGRGRRVCCGWTWVRPGW